MTSLLWAPKYLNTVYNVCCNGIWRVSILTDCICDVNELLAVWLLAGFKPE